MSQHATRIAYLAAALGIASLGVAAPDLTTPRVHAMPSAQNPAPARLTAVVTLQRSTVTGQAGSNAEVALEIAAPGGAVKGSAAGRSLPLFGLFRLDAAAADGGPAIVAAGDRVTVRSGEASIADSVPALSILGDADLDGVTGTAPPGAAVTVTVQSGLGLDAASRGAVADGSGRFTIGFGGAYDIDGFTTLRVDLVRGAFTFRAERLQSEQLMIRFYANTVGGLSVPGTPMAVELTRREGTVAGRGDGTTNGLGIWSATLVDAAGAPVDVRPGDRLRVLVAGSSILDYTVPELPVSADPATDSVQGTSPAGRGVTVLIDGAANQPARSVTAAADGSWRVSFAPEADIVPGTVGQLTMFDRKDGVDVTVYRAWAVTRLAVRLGEPVVTGVATPGEGVRLNLKDARGALRANTATLVEGGRFFGGGATFEATLENIQGDPIDVRPTDVLEFRQGTARIDLPIPTLTADIDTAADTVTGQAPPGAALRVTASFLFFNATRDVTADAAGRYAADFKGAFDLVGGIGVEVTQTVPEGHTITLATAASSLRVWPEAGRVDGSAAGGADVTVTALSETGTVLATGTDTANFLGTFDAPLRTPGGATYFPKPGDRIRIQFNNASKEMTVPALSIEWDTARERVFGEATPGGRVAVRARPPAGSGNGAETREQLIEAVSTYAAEFAPDQDLRAASRLEITYTYPNGDRSRVDRFLPYLNVQVGGNAVAGYALPRVDVVAALKDGATETGRGTAIADDGQAFDARIRSGGGMGIYVAITAGRTIDVEFEARHIALTVDNLSARFSRDEGATAIVGTGPTSTTLTTRVVGSNGQVRNQTVTTDGTGAFRLALPGGIDGLGGTSASVAFLNGEGHRQWALARIARLTAYLGLGSVEVEATPLTRTRLIWSERTDTLPELTTDTDGRLYVAIDVVGNQPRSGQTLSATIGTGAAAETASMTVADVRLALDTPRSTVTGRVPVGTGVLGRFAQLRLWPRDADTPTNIAVRTDADGNFTLDTMNPPGAGNPGASLASYDRVQVVHTNADGHRTIAEEAVTIAIYAPYVAKGARR
ncbi:MAG: hypothetical protein IT332_09980 [Ardenticatenales bacterium]|nr:hypothetical protein [Ardenticatenales bacterium]